MKKHTNFPDEVYKVDRNSLEANKYLKSKLRNHTPIFEYDEYKHDPIFDFDWKTDGWLLLGFIIFAVVIALTV